jgi:hypothetical protein
MKRVAGESNSLTVRMSAVGVVYLTENKGTTRQKYQLVLCGLVELNTIYYVIIVYYPGQQMQTYINNIFYINIYIFLNVIIITIFKIFLIYILCNCLSG